MKSISTPIGELRAEYDVVVVGSGYGGGIAAFRMAGRGLSVCVLERGIERVAGDFPASLWSALRDVHLDSLRGRYGRRSALFDLRTNDDVSVLVGNGLGGTSLINAGVMLSPLPEVFAESWPEVFRQNPDALVRLADQVKSSLGAVTYPGSPAINKAARLFAAGAVLEPPLAGVMPPIAVSFQSGRNAFGVDHRHCTLCGDCFSGCNHGAKNTVDRNYLSGARRDGAAIFCGIEVRSVERARDDKSWLLRVRIVDRGWEAFGEPEFTIRAGGVFLGAGTLGSTEILLRSRQRGTLHLSPMLGEHFSGNGDVIAFGYNGTESVNGIGFGGVVPADAAVGPTIVGMLDDRTRKDEIVGVLDDRRGRSGAVIQEGAVPGLLAPLIRFAAPFIARIARRPTDVPFDTSFKHIRREIDSAIRGVRHGALARTMTYLCMSLDDGSGTMSLAKGRVRIAWRGAGHQRGFKLISHRLDELTKQNKGRYVINPFWSRLFGRRLVTVHPLGGCAMGDSPEQGVVNDCGQVFNADTRKPYDHIYVCDGSIIPAPLGVNPALTISALAERILGHAPLPPLVSRPPAAGWAKPRTIDPTVPGIRYAERLRGWILEDGVEKAIELVLHISAESLEDVLQTPAHQASIVGIALTREVGSSTVVQRTVSSGTFNILVDDPRRVDTRLLVYQLKLTDDTGRPIWLRGHKTINLETLRKGVWKAITSFRLFAFDPDDEPPSVGPAFGDICSSVESGCRFYLDRCGTAPSQLGGIPIRSIGAGFVAAGVADSLRLAAAVEVMYERGVFRRLWLRTRFIYFFVHAIVEARIPLWQRTARVDPFTRQRIDTPKNMKTFEEVGDAKSASQPRFLLTKYESSSKAGTGKPVVLAPGFGMAADAFLVGSPSLVDHLLVEGYDVWLLDYRASDRLAISLTQFTLDELVEDFRDAIRTVHEQSNGQQVRVIAHCVASLATTMLLLKHGGEGRVRSVILSQSFAFIDHPLINRFKAWIRLPQVLMFLGFRPLLTTDYDVRSGFGSRLLDRLLRLYPTAEHCSSGVCRRILLLYGEVHRHAQLDKATHDKLYDLFDRANMTLFVHLSKMIRKGHVVDKRGVNTYLKPANGSNLTMPITLLQGHRNRLFRPPGAHRTLRWFNRHGYGSRAEPDLYALEEVPDYGHLDHFIGKNAATEVYWRLSAALERMEDVAHEAVAHP